MAHDLLEDAPNGGSSTKKEPSTPPPEYTSYIPQQGAPSTSSNVGVPPPSQHHPFFAPGSPPKQYGPTPMNPGAYAGPLPFGPGGGMAPIHVGNGVSAMGPTDRAGLLPIPFYDPNSPHSREMAAARARKRFFEALFWAIVIWVAVGMFTGASVEDIRKHPHRGQWYSS